MSVLCGAVVVVMGGSALALGAPATMPGWPVPAPRGYLLPGPGGGVTAIGNEGAFSVAAFRRDGTRRWAVARDAGCGVCLGGSLEPSVRPDGSIGPIGISGGTLWDVERDGRVVATRCFGLLLRDGTCVVTGGTRVSTQNASQSPTVTASAGGITRWTYVDSGYVWTPEDAGGASAPVADAAGRLYASLGDESASAAHPVVSLDPANGAVRWSTTLTGRTLAGLENGVLMSVVGGPVIALDADGAERWRLPASVTGATRAVLDIPRNRVLVQTGGVVGVARVAAVDLTSGVTQWLSRSGRPVTGMSLGSNGIVYVSEGRERTGYRVRAVRPSGATAWTLPTAVPAGGAVELSDGTVVVSTGGLFGGLLVRVNPKRNQARVTTGTVDVHPRRVRTGCVSSWARRACAPVVRLRLPTAATVTLRAVPSPPDTPATTLRAPAGVSYARFAGVTATTTALIATWREKGRRREVRIPVTVVGSRS